MLPCPADADPALFFPLTSPLQSLVWAPGACSMIQVSAVLTRAYTSGNFSQSPQLDTPRIENLQSEDFWLFVYNIGYFSAPCILPDKHRPPGVPSAGAPCPLVPCADVGLGDIKPLLPLVPGLLALVVADDGHVGHPESLRGAAIVRVVLEPPPSDDGLVAGVVLDRIDGWKADGLDLVAKRDGLGEGQYGIVPAHVVGGDHKVWVDNNLGHGDKLVLVVHPAVVTQGHANNTWGLQQTLMRT